MNPSTNVLVDRYARTIRYLRISVTDRCNLRCRYCMPAQGIALMPAEDLLTPEEIGRVATAAVTVGITNFRLTGGEPTLRRDLLEIVERIAGIAGVTDLALSTNGMLLEDLAEPLARAGLRRVNVSLDTLDAEKFKMVTRWGDIRKVWRGIDAAVAAGLGPVKLNMVAMKGINDGEILDFARMTREKPIFVRFIELMPIGSDNDFFSADRLLTMAEIRETAETLGPLEPAVGMQGSGPAFYLRYAGAPGALGFITPISDIFCARCNKLRLMADGRLRACLSGREEVDLKPILGGGLNGGTDPALREMFAEVVRIKPEKHTFHTADLTCSITAMAQIGG